MFLEKPWLKRKYFKTLSRTSTSDQYIFGLMRTPKYFILKWNPGLAILWTHPIVNDFFFVIKHMCSCRCLSITVQDHYWIYHKPASHQEDTKKSKFLACLQKKSDTVAWIAPTTSRLKVELTSRMTFENYVEQNEN